MCHPIFFGVLFGMLLARMFLFRRFGRGPGRFGGPGAGPWGPRWGHGRGWGGGLGAAWRGGDASFDASVGGGRFARRGPPPAASVDGSADGNEGRVGRLMDALELTDRQRSELDEVLTRLGESVGGQLDRWSGLDQALAVLAAPQFDRARAEAALPHVSGSLRAELVDGLEVAHNLLTTEQRDKLYPR